MYLVGVFRKGICAGHHGGRPLFQLAQLLTSLIQRYPSTRQLAHHAGGRPLHALDAAGAWDVLSQTPRGLPGSYLPNWMVEERRGRIKRGVAEADVSGFYVHSSSLSND